MPNHITNIITSDKDLDEVLKFMKSKISEFDFNNLLPMPIEMKETTSPANIVTQKEYDEWKKKPKQNEFFEGPLTAKIQKDYIRRFGADNWYKWSINNWGTKWNAYDIIADDIGAIEFHTAWDTPQPIFKALSKQFPDQTFMVDYADEDTGSNCGKMEFQNGEMTEYINKEGDAEFACNVNGYDYQEYLNDIKENNA